MKIGVLDVQGAVEPHLTKLRQLGLSTSPVKSQKALENLQGIILPGGESTAMIRLLKQGGLWESLRRFCAEKPCWGVCAGAILLSKRVFSPEQISLEAMDLEIERNAFGRQVDSFIGEVEPTRHWSGTQNLEAVFIRAPRIRKVFGRAVPLFQYGGEAVCAEQDCLLASTFHPELTPSSVLHEYFIKKCQGKNVHDG